MKTVSILGGGLAGLSLGIGLRRRGVPVRVVEAGDYPRHKVCGEFISGRGVAWLRRWGLEERLQPCGLGTAMDVRFFVEGDRSRLVGLPEPAWCLSRWRLDAFLADLFTAEGGVLETGQRVRSVPRESGWVVTSGRRRGEGSGGKWLGVKFHVTDLDLRADLEMHFQEGAYVGLCRVAEGVNVCALLPRQRARPGLGADPLVSLGELFSRSLKQRLAGARLVEESFVSVAGLDYRAASGGAELPLCLGDAGGLIPPLTGNGMSLAFESAGLAMDPISRWARGQEDWSMVKWEVRARLRAQFDRRLMVARGLQRWLVSDVFRTSRRWGLPLLPLVLPLGFRLTR